MGHAELQPQPKSLSELQAGLASGRMMEGVGGGGVQIRLMCGSLARI